MNKKIKLITVFSTVATTAAEPISDLAQTQINEKSQENTQLQSKNGNLKEWVGGGYDLISSETPTTETISSPFTGYVPSTFDNAKAKIFDNGSFNTIQNDSYVVVPYWSTATKRPYYNSFAAYSIDSNTQQLSTLSSNTKLGYDVTNKVILPPQLVGEELVTFFRDWNIENPYGLGEWSVGVTNIKTGDFTTYSLAASIGESTINFRNLYIMTNEDISSPTYYLALYEYNELNLGKLRVSKISNFNPRNTSHALSSINELNISGKAGILSETTDLIFGNGYATPKHKYLTKEDKNKPLFGWTNLLEENQIKPIDFDYAGYGNSKGYWLFPSDEGIVTVNLGDDGKGNASLKLGTIDSNNKTTPSAKFSFITGTRGNGEYDFYNGTSITFTMVKGYKSTYYLIPNGVKDDSGDIKSLSQGTRYFGFNYANGVISNLNSYDYNAGNNIFKNSDSFKNSKLNYIASFGSDLITVDTDYAASIASQKHWRTQQESLIDKLTSFLSKNLYFVDLTSFYANLATEEQKASIENLAKWLGKDGDFSFAPMTIEEMTDAVERNLSMNVTDADIDKIIKDFAVVQATLTKNLLQLTYNKWIISIEGYANGTGHQWGWYNENNLTNMFQAYVIDNEKGLIYDKTDTDLENPKEGLQKLVSEFQNKLATNTPIRFQSLLDAYLEPVSGSDIENTYNEYKTLGTKQFEWYSNRILDEFKGFYYGVDDPYENNLILEKFLNNGLLITDSKELLNKWRNMMSEASYENMTVLESLSKAEVWENIPASKIAGKDATLEQYIFEYTSKLNLYKDFVLDWFNQMLEYVEWFLQYNYRGYGAEIGSINIDSFIDYSSGEPVYNREWMIKNFVNGKETFEFLNNNFGKLCLEKSEGKFEGKFSIDRTATGDTLIEIMEKQDEMFLANIVSIVNSVEDYYFGYKSTINNDFIRSLFGGSAEGTKLDANTIRDFYFQNSAGKAYAIKYNLNTHTSSIEEWKKDQKDQIISDLQKIIDGTKGFYYYGFPNSSELEEALPALLGKLLFNFNSGDELTAENIFSSISKEKLPKNLNGLWELKTLVEGIDSEDIRWFFIDQENIFNTSLDKILDLFKQNYFGFAPSQSVIESDEFLRFIFNGRQENENLDSKYIIEKYKENYQNGDVELPKPWKINKFLNALDKDASAKILFNDQLNKTIERMTTLFSWISPWFYGFNPRILMDEGVLVDEWNEVGVYAMMGWTWGQALDPVVLSKYMLENISEEITDIGWSMAEYIGGRYHVKAFFDNLTQSGEHVTTLIDFQKQDLKSMFNDLITKIKKYYLGYISETNFWANNYILLDLPNGTNLENIDLDGLLAKFIDNVIQAGGNWFPKLYEVELYLNRDITKIDQFEQEQNKKFEDDVTKIINSIKENNWGYKEASIPESFYSLFFSEDRQEYLTIEETMNIIREKCNSDKGIYSVFSFLNEEQLTVELESFVTGQTEQLRNDLLAIFQLLNKYYFGFEMTSFTATSEVFAGSMKISYFFYEKDTQTDGLPTDFEEFVSLFKTQIMHSEIVKDKEKRNDVADFLRSLYSNSSGENEAQNELKSYKDWAEPKLTSILNSLAQDFFDNYSGFSNGDDLLKLKLWFGLPNNGMIKLEDILRNLNNYIKTLPLKKINSSLQEFLKELGTSDETTILGRDFKMATQKISEINQLWRNNYLGFTGYTGNWFFVTYNDANNNWNEIITTRDLNTARQKAFDDSQKLLSEYVSDFGLSSKNLIDFKAFQDSEMLRVLQTIVDYYNQWYMGYQISSELELETTSQIFNRGWNFTEVRDKITNSIVKDSKTNIWEAQHIQTKYDESGLTNFKNEQMNALITNINDNLINDFLKNNYFGYNTNLEISTNAKIYLTWQNSQNPDAIWDTSSWIYNDWSSKDTSTYKIFSSLDENHASDLQSGKTFKNILEPYFTQNIESPAFEFALYQVDELTYDIFSLISDYQDAYYGYTSQDEINKTFLPGLTKTLNNNFNWSLNESVKALKDDVGHYQDPNRAVNGKWLRNSAIGMLTDRLTVGNNSFINKEKNAYEADLDQIITEYQTSFRGFTNDVNGNKLSYKSLGGDEAIENGVLIQNWEGVTSKVFDKEALKLFLSGSRNTSATPTWEANLISIYRTNLANFQTEQTNIFRNYLEDLANKYANSWKGYFTSFNGSPLKFNNFPGTKINPDKFEIDLELAISLLDEQTFTKMAIPSIDALYRLSYDAWKFFTDELKNFESEQTEMSDKDASLTKPGFTRQEEIFNLLSEEEGDTTWGAKPNSRFNYQDSNLAKQALAAFLNQAGEQTSLADLNDITSNWFSSFQGDKGADWNDVATKHNFMFFAEYGMPLQLFFEPSTPSLLKNSQMKASIVNIQTGEYILNGDIDSIKFTATSKDDDKEYGPTLVITKGTQQFTYKMMKSDGKSNYDQMLFAVADISSGTPAYSLAQKITINKSFTNNDSSESTVSVINYDELMFSFSNLSLDYDGSSTLPLPVEWGINTLKSVNIFHQTTKVVNDLFIQIGMGNDLITGHEVRSNISIMSPQFDKTTQTIDEVISRLANQPEENKLFKAPLAKTINNISSTPIWVKVLVALSTITIIGPIIFLSIKRIKKIKNAKLSKNLDK
ncbi:MAG: hypothetical protein ACRAS9_01565 [Mycoplasma sp.]